MKNLAVIRSVIVSGAAVILAGAAVTLAAPASQAAAGASDAATGWRTAATVAQEKGSAGIASIAAVSAGDAWASGATVTSGGKHAPVIDHWAGRSWQGVRLPAKVARTWNSSGLDGAAIGASSASNVWVAGATASGVHYAHSSKRGWQFGTIPGTADSSQPLALTIVTTINVISRTDVWVFGLRVSGSSATVTPYAAQFAAHRWHTRTVPGNGAIAAVIVTSPKKMLALVGSDEFLGFGTDTPTVVQWNGRKWTSLPVQPKSLPGDGAATSMAEAGGHIWIGGNYPLSGAHLGEWADFVAELTGSTWKLRELRNSASGDEFQLNSLVPDGHGGLWALGMSYTLGVSQRLWHYTGRLWRAPISPRFGGSASELSQLVAVPGTDSIWGAGTLTRGGSLDGLIALDGPTPG
jgi:hypothetical protein